jgi:Flp pilus assembly protein TadD
LLLALSVLTFQRAQVYSSDEALLRDTLAKNPAAWAAHNDLGCLLAKSGHYHDAVDQFAASLKLNPDFHDAHSNLGQALALQGRFEEARRQFLAALKIQPHNAETHKRFATALAARGKSKEALHHLRLALCLQPDIQMRLDFAALLYETGDLHQAVEQLRKASILKPDMPEPFNNLAWLLATCSVDSLRDGPEAVRCAKRACHLTEFKHHAMIGTLAAAYAEAGRFPQAISAAEMAVRLEAASGETRSVHQQLLRLYRAGKPCREGHATDKTQ